MSDFLLTEDHGVYEKQGSKI